MRSNSLWRHFIELAGNCQADCGAAFIGATIWRMVTQLKRLPASTQSLLALLIPPIGAYLIVLLARVENVSLFLAAMGLLGWLLGMVWHSVPRMGARGGRPLFAGIGFAVLAWLAALLARFLIDSDRIVNGGLGQPFVYLLLFEAIFVQLWAFGLFFGSVAEWRGGMAAAFSSGAVFGLTGWLFFGESLGGGFALLYFVMWGWLYGIIRLRSGSWLGIVVVQAMQTLTVWHLLVPASPPEPAQYSRFYLMTSALFLLIIWRLLPKSEGDYRV